MFKRSDIIKELRAKIKVNGHVIGVAAGSGLSAKYTVMGGADFILALSSGKYRQMGRSSLAAFLSYSNSNEIVMDYAAHELLPVIREVPVLFGLHASDPTIRLGAYLRQIKEQGFSGVNNFPSVGLIDGQFREALEEEGVCFGQEVDAIALAHSLDLFTVGFAFNREQALQMAQAGADVVCAHLGLTTGGMLGAKQFLSLESSKALANEIFTACDEIRPDIIKMVYGGVLRTPFDVLYMYENTSCAGYIGGSSFERIPSERAILSVTRAFKSADGLAPDDLISKIMNGIGTRYDYVDFVREYIHSNYMQEISLTDLAAIAHISPSYLSAKFKKEVGASFKEYLVRFRVDKAAQLLDCQPMPMQQAASLVGYKDYAQFSKIFKKYKGCSPREYARLKQKKLSESSVQCKTNHKFCDDNHIYSPKPKD